MISIVKEEYDVLLIKLDVSEANLENAEAFKAEMIGLLNEHNKNLILNLESVDYVDSSFLGALVAVLKHAISLKKDVVLVGLKKDIHDLLQLIRLDKVFKIYSDYDQALQAR